MPTGARLKAQLGDGWQMTVIACPDEIELKQTCDVQVTGHTPQAARTAAASSAVLAAISKAFLEAKDLVCHDDCPIRRFWLHIEKPDLTQLDAPQAAPAAQVWTASATCTYKGVLKCIKRDAPAAKQKDEIPEEPQQFTCDDPLTIIAEGYAKGSVTAPQPTTAQESLALVAAVAADLEKMFRYKVQDAVDAFRGPTVRCQNKEVVITRWQPGPLQRGGLVAQPPRGKSISILGLPLFVRLPTPPTFYWSSQAWYRVEAHCE
jgi:hypothetical protein